MERNKRLLVMMITSCLLLFFGSMSVFAQPFGIGSTPPQEKPEQGVLSSGNGRYVFGQISDSSKDKFMLDTLSGRLWQIAETGEAGVFLRAVPYRTEEGKLSPLPESLSGVGKK